ncbi:MAG: OTU domain-containing protein [Sulfobacillus sp.]
MSCLFRALCLFHPEYSERTMRKKIVRYLASNPQFEIGSLRTIVDWTEDASLESYVKHMSEPDSWGGGIEIKAFCELFGERVIVAVLQNGNEIEFEPDDKRAIVRTIRLTWNGSHFEADREG